jgi:superfamily II DNA/RNA helicase
MTVRRPLDPSPASFSALGVPPLLVGLLAARSITEPFPIQAATLPDALAGRDILGKGRTGSGKTYAFVLPLLARLASAPGPRRPGRPRALILAPTRELATQIHATMAPLATALSLRTMTVFGGVTAGRQIAELRSGVDVVVACPGRLEDHAANGHVDLRGVEITVLDEADHMADLGFLPAVRRLLDQTPRSGQRLLFSATLDSGVDVLVRRYLRDPVAHDADPVLGTGPALDHHVLYLDEDDRLAVLVDLTAAPGRSIVFARTKHRAKALTRKLVAAGVAAVELHGNLAQTARDRNLSAFAAGTATTLVATDIAARGIHVDDVRIIIHADPPAEHKAYLHRSGRSGRAGASGTVVTLTTDAQRPDVHEMTRRAGVRPTATRISPGHPLLAELAPGMRRLASPSMGRPVAPGSSPSATRARTPRAGQSASTRDTSRQAPREARAPKNGALAMSESARPARRGARLPAPHRST